MAASSRWLSSRSAAAIAVGLALVVAALWYRRTLSTPVVAEPAASAIVSIRITRRDSQGMPSSPKPIVIRDRAHVRAIVDALGIDAHPPTECPADYAAADLGLLLSGRDIYARRNVYLWRTATEVTTVITVTSAGCRGGPPSNADELRRELEMADAG